MFKYTKASANILINDFKKWATIFKWIAMVFTVGFLSYQLITRFISTHKISWIHAVLLGSFIVFTILDLIFVNKKTARKVFKRIYNWIKICAKVITIGEPVLEIYFAGPGGINGLNIILETLLIIVWILSFASEILVEIMTDRIDMLLYAWKADMEEIKAPFTAASNVVKRFTGKEIKAVKRDPKQDKIVRILDEEIFNSNIRDEDYEDD